MSAKGFLAAPLLIAAALYLGGPETAPAAPRQAGARAGVGKPGPIRIEGVGFAADGGIIMVSFTCDPRDTPRIYQGTVSVVEEATGEVYRQIIVLPKIGPLIGRPMRRGQKGFVMLANPGGRLKPGARVTVEIAGSRRTQVRAEDWAPQGSRGASAAPPKEVGR